MSQVPAQFDVGKLTIPLFIGTVMNCALLGALAVQVYIFFLAFPKDRRLNKLIVVFIFVAEILQTLGDGRNTIETFGSQWGNFQKLDEVRWAWFSVPILGSTIACVGQLFFAWRIWIIGHTRCMPAVITAITAFQWGGGIWTGVDIIRAKRFSLLRSEQLRPPIAWLSATAATDIIIVAATLYYITRARDSEFKFSNTTNTAISRIIRVSVETGVLCALFAIIDLSLFVRFNGNNYHLAVCTWLSKVYSNSIMVILNSRAYIGHAIPPNAPQPHMSDLAFRSFGPVSAVRMSVARGTSGTESSTSVDSHSFHEMNLNKEHRQMGTSSTDVSTHVGSQSIHSSHEMDLNLDRQRGQLTV
ncbi:hypothetical protein MSAN_01085800 [Mycena sanguinolenta]|uniref:DUF6534 domain-containing protein n=1 Tax=Mycena sanguinolenta TaxID=230812 RepID=A0A8H6YNA0_9AGAR|nr:hypothetical protein MSAN_01085800 [Mycena sanguinolenta]